MNKRQVIDVSDAGAREAIGLVRVERYEFRNDRPFRIVQLDQYRALWAECHTIQDPTGEWFSDWLNRVPKSCGCDKSLQAILDELGPPDYANWFPFSVRLHNLVNRKLSKPELSHDEARAIWK